jgi:glycerate 2-kinase
MTSPEIAIDIWNAAVAAANPEDAILAECLRRYDELAPLLNAAERILVVGAGKAGGRMAAGLEAVLQVERNVVGLVNVPEGTPQSTARIRLHPARPAGSNHPTAAGVAGADEMLNLLASAGPNDVAFCLLSGGGSALLPAPAEGISLEDKQAITKLLHACGATINEMNAVRKHLSRVKGGRLATAFRGRALFNLIVSDVVGDPLDVIASGPTAPDPTTFADALAMLDKFELRSRTPANVLAHLERGARGEIPETPKAMTENVVNAIVASNSHSLEAAKKCAQSHGYAVLDLGPFVEGETKDVAVAVVGIVRNIRARGEPLKPPACILFGGETTVTLGANAGKGGRNQEFVLAMLDKLGEEGMKGVTALSAGTDGEDGPTDAAGAVATRETIIAAKRLGLSTAKHLANHDAYPFFDATGGLIRTGLTGTNVMDVRVVLVD